MDILLKLQENSWYMYVLYIDIILNIILYLYYCNTIYLYKSSCIKYCKTFLDILLNKVQFVTYSEELNNIHITVLNK